MPGHAYYISISSNTLDYLVTFTARKTEAGVDYLVVVLIADRKYVHAVDVVESVAMEENTVTLSLDAPRSQIASDGRVAV